MSRRLRSRRPLCRPLRVGSHNLGGLTHKQDAVLHAAARVWAQHRLDVVCLQETHHMGQEHMQGITRGLGAAAQRLGVPGWEVVGQAPTPAARTAGVVVLVRKDVMRDLSVVATPARLTPPDAPKGRFVPLSFTWGGHRIHLANMYLPTSRYSAGERRAFVDHTLGSVAKGATEEDQLLWVGDFNFVHDPHLDSTAGEGGRGADTAVAAAFQEACPRMLDTFRRLHPTRRAFSHLYRTHVTGGSRLDRIYASSNLMPFVVSSTIPVPTPSDHRLAVVTLLPRVTSARGPGLPRLRTGFLGMADLKRRFVGWVKEECERRPAGRSELLEWWPVFKRRLACEVASLSRQARDRQIHPELRVRLATELAAVALADMDAGGITAQRLSVALDAQEAVVKALRAEGAVGAKAARVAWLREGERPSRGLTALVHPQRAATSVTALQDGTGRLVTDVTKLPQMVADYWGAICTAPDIVSEEAREAVIGALRERHITIPAADATEVGRPEVSVAEVEAVLKAATPGKSPGLDGIPVELYKACRTELAPAMADVFTAIGRAGRVPSGFLEGVITVLYKNRGSPAMPGSYRPITLLGTDYRVLAKVLTNRLGPVLGRVVTLEQSAFLPDRLIGANVHFLRQLPHLMAQTGRSCVIAFLDIAKAYDSLDRKFLFEAMEAMGAGPGLLSWSRLLLSATASRAVVNGFLSDRVALTAGVRQGCPLAPLLYLFAAQALLCWLQHNRVGIRLRPEDSEVVTAVQFADDTEVVLQGMDGVSEFIQCMDVYARASGQQLNLDKVELLPVGSAPAPARLIQGLRVVPSATALNLPFTDVGTEPAMDWATQAEKVWSRFERIASLYLSVFGRASAAAAYGLHRLTWHMEHGGLPPEGTLTDLEAKAAKLIDRGQGPSVRDRRATGIPKRLLLGHPTAGGFGALPLREHVQARWACWAVRFVRGVARPATARPPWVGVMDAFLRGAHPAYSPLCLFTSRPGIPWFGEGVLPPDLARIVTALAHLPPVEDVAEAPLVPGAWCWHLPLWGNPLLPETGPHVVGARERPGLEFRHPELVGCRALRTLGDALRARNALDAVLHAPDQAGLAGRAAWHEAVAQYLRPQTPLATSFCAFRRWQECCEAVAALLADVPPGWRLAASMLLPLTEESRAAMVPPVEVVLASVVARLGWRWGGGPPVALAAMSVQVGTVMQLSPVVAARRAAHARFVQEALGIADPSVPLPVGALSSLQCVFSRLWSSLRWENEHKEAWWRLTVDGVPLLGNSHMRGARPAACGCGGFPGGGPDWASPRGHHFWACPVAQAVLDHLALAVGRPVSRADVWLVQAPEATRQCVWDVVVLAAVSAMEGGRRFMAAAQKGVPAASPGPALLERAITRVVVTFWSRLRGFAALGLPRKGWDSVGPRHPFLRVVSGVLECSRPEGPYEVD